MRIENVQGEPEAWVTPDTVDGQTVNGKPRRIWWENNEGVGIPIYTTPQPAYLPLDLPLFARRMDEELEKHDIQGFEPVVLAVAEEVMGYEQQPMPQTEMLDDDSLARQIGEIGNQIHNLGCGHQNDEGLADRLSEIAHQAWKLQRSVMVSKQPPEPDGAQLVEALVAIKARIRGEFDHPALVRQGPLGELRDDIERIIDSAPRRPPASKGVSRE